MRTKTFYLIAILLSIVSPSLGATIALLNAGFEDESGWSIDNAAEQSIPGGTSPWSWQTPANFDRPRTLTFDETVTAVEGDRFALTYSVGSSLIQEVDIPESNTYLFTVEARAIPGKADSFVLGDGAFIASGSRSGITALVPISAGWQRYRFIARIAAGRSTVGLSTVRTPNSSDANSQFAIAFDNFRIIGPINVPEPTASGLLGWALLTLGCCRSRANR